MCRSLSPSPWQHPAGAAADDKSPAAGAHFPMSRPTAGFTVHHKLRRKLGRSVALLWQQEAPKQGLRRPTGAGARRSTEWARKPSDPFKQHPLSRSGIKEWSRSHRPRRNRRCADQAAVTVKIVKACAIRTGIAEPGCSGLLWPSGPALARLWPGSGLAPSLGHMSCRTWRARDKIV